MADQFLQEMQEEIQNEGPSGDRELRNDQEQGTLVDNREVRRRRRPPIEPEPRNDQNPTYEELMQRIHELEQMRRPVEPPVAPPIVHKVDPPKPFTGNPATLKRWISQVETYFHLTNMTNELNRHYMISILVDGKAADWWNERKQKYVTWEQIKAAFSAYYKDHHVRDKAYMQMRDLRQTGDIMVYLAEMDRLNASVKLSESEMIDFIQCGIKDTLHYDMKFYSNLKSNPDEWRYKLIEMGTMRKAPDAPKSYSKSSRAGYPHTSKK